VFVSKYCGRCKQVLPKSAFNRAGKGRQHWCRECFRRYFRERGRLHLDQVRAAKAIRKGRLRERLLSHLRAHPCVDCGEVDIRVLEFDHVGEKAHAVSELLTLALPLAKLDAEIERCEVVCVNCHRRRTATRAGWRRIAPPDPDDPLRPRRRRNLEFVYGHLRTARCSDCGLSDPLVLEFDHVGNKRAGVLELAWDECSVATLAKEMAVCEVRCCNCHRRRTVESEASFRAAGYSRSEPP
jgi:hypothetical protein